VSRCCSCLQPPLPACCLSIFRVDLFLARPNSSSPKVSIGSHVLLIGFECIQSHWHRSLGCANEVPLDSRCLFEWSSTRAHPLPAPNGLDATSCANFANGFRGGVFILLVCGQRSRKVGHQNKLNASSIKVTCQKEEMCVRQCSTLPLEHRQTLQAASCPCREPE